MATPNIEDNLFYSAIKIMPACFLMQQKKDLTAKYTAMINEKLIPQYKNGCIFKTVFAASRASSGIGSCLDKTCRLRKTMDHNAMTP
jgi:uncharacterized protein (DUF885 family)